MKWWADHMQVSGVNFLIPHSFNPRAPYDNDCPPYFYNGGYEPRWPLYRVLADYTCRLSLMLTRRAARLPGGLALESATPVGVGKAVMPEGDDRGPAGRPLRLRLAAVRRARARRGASTAASCSFTASGTAC